jgi:hypothetical protein
MTKRMIGVRVDSLKYSARREPGLSGKPAAIVTKSCKRVGLPFNQP